MWTKTMSLMASIDEEDLDITPTFDAPWMGPLNNLAGQIIGTLLVVSVIVLAVGVVLFLVGRAASNSGMQGKGAGALIVGGIGVAVLGSIVGLVLFFANIDLI